MTVSGEFLGERIGDTFLTPISLFLSVLTAAALIVLIRFLPRVLERVLRSLFPGWHGEVEDTGPEGLVHTVILALVLGGIIALLFVAGWGFGVPVVIGGHEIYINSLLNASLVIVVSYAFATLLLPWMLDRVITLLTGEHWSTKTVEEAKYAVLGPVKAFVVVMTVFLAYIYYLPRDEIYDDFIRRLFWASLVAILTIIVARLIVAFFRQRYLSAEYMGAAGASAISNFIKIGVYIAGFGVALSMAGVDVVYWVTALGLIGFAVAFGLQDTIANIASGVSLATEKPFEIGDRIRVGDTVGDVIDITLRSTRVRTIENQTVAIPNSVMAKQEVWNLTRDSPIVVLTIAVNISYDSDWRLAEHLMTTVARDHPKVMNAPSPRVYMINYGESGVELSLWVWVFAQDIYEVRSDLMKAVKDRFDIEGVEIPFRYITLVNKSELPKPRKIEREIFTEKGPVYPWEPAPKEIDIQTRERKKILVPTAGPVALESKAEYVLNLAKSSDRDVVVLYIVPLHGRSRSKGWDEISRTFTTRGNEKSVNVELVKRRGDVVEEILKASSEWDVDLIVMGASARGVMKLWMERDVVAEVSQRSTVPVIVIPHPRNERSRESKRVKVRQRRRSS